MVEDVLGSESYQRWYDEACQMFDLHEGTQFTQEEITTFDDAGLNIYATNLVAARIEAMLGKLITTRTKVKFISRSQKPEERATAEALTDLATFVQDKNKSGQVLTDAMLNAAICGVGWHQYVTEGQTIKEESVNPLDMIFDPRDRTTLMQNQMFVARMHYLSYDEAMQRWPNREDELNCINTAPDSFRIMGERLYNSTRLRPIVEQSWISKELKQVMVIQLQYRRPKKFYFAPTKRGAIVSSFEKEHIKKLASKKSLITEDDGMQVCEAWFTASGMLEHNELANQFDPQVGSFTFTPVVCYRERISGQPFGVMRRMKDPQRLYTLKQSKLNWIMGTAQVIADKGAVDNMADAAKEVARPDGFITINGGKRFEINGSAQKVAEHFQALEMHKRDLQEASGIYDEALGVQTNATSGVAIARRQNASAATQALIVDRFQRAKYIIAEKLLELIRGTFTEETAFYILDDEQQAKLVHLNAEKSDEDGETYRLNDVRVGEFNIAVDETSDAVTQTEDSRQRLLELVQAGMPIEKITEGLLDLIGIPKTSELRKEVAAGVQQKIEMADAMQKQIAEPAQAATGMAGGPATALQPPNGTSM
jgi:hypothetical protein